ncbi:MAG: hypothetical protein GKS00_06735 [Alphaproteobacteria bacterium]|nr:hypothetical protein [Alphaproteobacteria bacterium]
MEPVKESGRGGTTKVTEEEIRAATHGVAETFFDTRHSVRQFTDLAVDRQLIEESLKRAQRTPSVCNRQCARVHVLTDSKAKAKALSFQNGNRGFGSQASVIFIVTADLSVFTDAGERFQGWIDGGMYAMSLVYALHSLGLGSCTLNWSVAPGIDRRMRSALNIPENELVIMMIAAGHIPDSFKVASSPRLPVEVTTRFVTET